MKYTKRQINFIINKKVKQNLSYSAVARLFNEKFNESKTGRQIKDICLYHCEKRGISQAHDAELQKQEKIQEIIEIFTTFTASSKYVPSKKDLIDLGVSNSAIKTYFGGITALEDKAREEHPDVFDEIIDAKSFTKEGFKSLEKDVKKYKRFVITTAITGCDVHAKGLKSLGNYCKRNDAKLLILPCSDPSSNRKCKWSLDHRLPKESVVFQDLRLNEKLFLSTIKLSAKHINPLTGMSRISQKSGSVVYASPKQFLEHVATANDKRIPRALMTPGAITKPQYQTSKYMAERTSYIANEDHTLGAIVVEVKNNKVFYYRQIQIESKTGSFIDLGKKYSPDGKISVVKADLVRMGDYHVGETCPKAKAGAKRLCAMVQPTYLTVEDFFNGKSINHHESKMCITQAKKAEQNEDSLEKELHDCAKEIDELTSWKGVGNLVVIYGNHENFLDRYLESGAYIYQPANHKISVKLASAMFDDKIPFEFAMRELFGLKTPKRVRFLDMNTSWKLSGIENGAHGHLGANGSRNPNNAALERCYGACNAGHNHSAGILRNVFRVGTKSHLKVSYNNGPSSWTQTDLVQYPNGSRQLITYIDGEFMI